MSASNAIAILNVAALVTMMFATGLSVGHRDILIVGRSPRGLALGLIANYMLIPVVTLGLLMLFRADPMASVGFLILACSPGAPLGPRITAIARGDEPQAVGMMLVLAGLSAPLTPALLGALLPFVAPGADPRVSYLAIVRVLLITQLLPLALGMGFRGAAPGWARVIDKPAGLLANVLLLALVGAIVATQHAMLAAIRPRAWLGMGLLLAASLGLGWRCGGSGLAGRKSLAITTSTRNVAVGLVIAARDFAGTPAVSAIVAYGLFSILGALCFAILLGRSGPIPTEVAPNASALHDNPDASRSRQGRGDEAPASAPSLSLAPPDQHPRLADRAGSRAGSAGDAGRRPRRGA